MSLEYAAQKLSDNHYVLPMVGTMKVEAHAFLSEALYLDEVLAVLEAEGIARVAHRLYPVANIKGAD
jgi:hypothetical protein